MAVFWTTEAIPISVTAMLPIIVFPMMGVSKVKDLASKYVNKTDRHDITEKLLKVALNTIKPTNQSNDWKAK
jgi:sodium-dependent dicarboxylate transporter 2/3/5